MFGGCPCPVSGHGAVSGFRLVRCPVISWRVVGRLGGVRCPCFCLAWNLAGCRAAAPAGCLVALCIAAPGRRVL